MTINTTNYEFTWGRKPRGEGYWAFQFWGVDTRDRIEFAPGEMNYAAAKRWAIRRAREIGASRVSVAT